MLKNLINLQKHMNELEEQGFVVIENILTAAECTKLASELDALEQKSSINKDQSIIGNQTRQLQLLNVHYQCPSVFLRYINQPDIIEVVSRTLNDDFILSNFNASRALKNDSLDYRIHIDSRKPNPHFESTYQIVANICIDDFTATNGSTVVVPGSHMSGVDPRGMKVPSEKLKKAVAPKGSVVFMTGQTWHDIGQNQDSSRRWSIIAYYSCWWIKPTYDFVSNCTPEIFNMCSDEQKKLLGFTSRPPTNWDMRQKTICDINKLPKELDEAITWDGY